MTPTLREELANLPVELTSFVNRRTELADGKRLLSQHRLLTLTGPGGVGKTRLALRVAADVRRAFGDGVWLVELDQLRDPSLLVHTVANTLRLREDPGALLMPTLVEQLASRQVLLILDNCEHLIEAVAQLADTLIRSCPRVRVLATSREPLGVAGETTLPVLPLPVPEPGRPSAGKRAAGFDAVTLFADRAAAVVPSFDLTEGNEAVVARICRRLEGVPLAIELTAPWLRTLSTEQILDQLDGGHELLHLPRRGVPERQQTLHACIEWSYELCSPAEQRLWTRLTVFTGGFDLDAVGAVWPELDEADTLDLVAALVDKSVLLRDDHGPVARYRMLEAVNEFGMSRLDEQELVALRRRHRDWCLDLVSRAHAEWMSERQIDWRPRLEREFANIRAALDFCRSRPGESETGLRLASRLHPFWLASGRFSEARHWLDPALRKSAEPSVARAEAVYTAGLLASMQRDIPAATDVLEIGRAMAARLDDEAVGALVTHTAANLAFYSGDLGAAVDALARVVPIWRALERTFHLIDGLLALVLARTALGEDDAAQACCEELLEITTQRREVWHRGYALWTYSFAMLRRGELERADELAREALRLKRQMDDPVGAIWCLYTLAWIAADEHDHVRAAVVLGAATTLQRTLRIPGLPGPDTVVRQEEYGERVRQELGPREFNRAFEDGARLDLAAAISYALGEQPETPTRDEADGSALTRREREVADLVAKGMTNKEIAARLVISQRTAETHVEHILTKLGFTSRAQIASWVARGT